MWLSFAVDEDVVNEMPFKEDSARAREMFENGLAACNAGDYTRAMDLFSSAQRLDPHNAGYCGYLGLAISHRPSRFNEAREYCERAIAMEPFNPQHYLNLAEVYKVAQKHDKAIKVFQDVLKLDPENSQALMNLKQYAEEGNREEPNRFEKLVKRLKW